MSGAQVIVRDTPAMREAHRVMTLCNSCRYCESVCATFQAMTERRTFATADLDYLANVCHNCTACFHSCQFAPPHEFAVNVPEALADVRVESYAAYAWPRPLARAFARNGVVVVLVTAAILTLTMFAVGWLVDARTLFAVHVGAGAFYQVIPHIVMASAAGATFGFSVLAMWIGYLRFRGAAGRRLPWKARIRSMAAAARAAATQKYQGGVDGEGCPTSSDAPSNARRHAHHATMWGFMLCFLATVVAFVYDALFGWPAPYGYFSLPVVLGSVGGLGLIVGPLALMALKRRAEPAPAASARGLDHAFLVSLVLVSATGFGVLLLRETAAMGLTLAIHLGFVFAFFVLLPYSKFVHAIYRFAALVQFYEERS